MCQLFTRHRVVTKVGYRWFLPWIGSRSGLWTMCAQMQLHPRSKVHTGVQRTGALGSWQTVLHTLGAIWTGDLINHSHSLVHWYMFPWANQLVTLSVEQMENHLDVKWLQDPSDLCWIDHWCKEGTDWSLVVSGHPPLVWMTCYLTGCGWNLMGSCLSAPPWHSSQPLTPHHLIIMHWLCTSMSALLQSRVPQDGESQQVVVSRQILDVWNYLSILASVSKHLVMSDIPIATQSFSKNTVVWRFIYDSISLFLYCSLWWLGYLPFCRLDNIMHKITCIINTISSDHLYIANRM